MSASMTRTKTPEGGHSGPPQSGLEKPPSDWEMSPIGDLTLQTKQRNPERDPEKRFFYVDVSSVSNTSFRITAPTELSGVEAPSRARKVIQAGDVLFATVRPTLKRVALVPDDLHDQIASTGFIVLRADTSRLDSAYLYYRLLTDEFIHRMQELERGASYPAVRDSDICNEEIPLPPLAEQQKIAGVLGLVQQAIEQQEKLIALTTELKKTLLHKLFTEGLHGEPQKQTDIGPIPKSWNVVPLTTLLTEPLRNGHSAKASNNGEGIRTLTLTAVTRRDFSVENTKLTVADPHRVRDMWLQSGDILVERANTFEYVGLTALYEGPNDFAIYPDLMIRVRVDKDKIKPKFLAEFLITPVCRSYFQKQARSTAGNFPKIDQGTVEETLVPSPSVKEQDEIVSLLTQVDRKLSVHESKHAALTVLFRTLLHQLMTAQIRVHHLNLSELKTAGKECPCENRANTN